MLLYSFIFVVKLRLRNGKCFADDFLYAFELFLFFGFDVGVGLCELAAGLIDGQKFVEHQVAPFDAVQGK